MRLRSLRTTKSTCRHRIDDKFSRRTNKYLPIRGGGSVASMMSRPRSSMVAHTGLRGGIGRRAAIATLLKRNPGEWLSEKDTRCPLTLGSECRRCTFRFVRP